MQNESFPEIEFLPEVITETITNVESVPEVSGQVIMHCLHYGCNSECGKSLSCEIILNSGIQLVPVGRGNPSDLLHTYNIQLAPAKNFKKSYGTHFTLVFSALPKNCTSFHFIEPDGDGDGWKIYNIKRCSTDVYKLFFARHSAWEGEVDF